MRDFYAFSFAALFFLLVVVVHGANVSSSNSVITGYSTIIVNTSLIIPNYQNEYIEFMLYPSEGNSSYTTLELLNQSSFAQYNMSVKLINNSGYPPFLGQILISPTVYTPVKQYQIQLQAVGGDPSNYTETVNVSILNRSLYETYLQINAAMNSVTHGNSSTSVGTIQTTQQTAPAQNATSSAQSSFYTVNTSIAATTAAGLSGSENAAPAYAAVVIIIVIIVAAYLLLRNRKPAKR